MGHSRRLVVVAIAGAFATGGCGSPSTPSTIFAVACPATRTAESPAGSPVAVAFEPPAPSGGTPPFSTTCSPQSGSPFPIGTTRVTCQSSDAARRSASCTFNVTVTLAPRLLYTRFLSFGDSITEGKVADPVVVANSLGAALRLLDVDRISAYLNAAEPYPLGLQRRLTERYATQSFRVDNAGIGGEFAAEGGVARFNGVVLSAQPEVVLLMEGSNDLLSPSGADAAIAALDVMIRQALAQGRRICIATVPPQRPDGLRNRAIVAARVPPFNDRVRALATTHQVVLVDVYNAMKDDLTLIGPDDLHPTERGYGVIADTFAAAVRSNFEQTATTVPAARGQ